MENGIDVFVVNVEEKGKVTKYRMANYKEGSTIVYEKDC